MGIDVKAMFEHNLDMSGIREVPSLLTPERFPLLHTLAWRHPLWQGETPAEERPWRWEMPKGCTSFEEAWALQRDTSDPLLHSAHLKSGHVILTFEDRIADLYTPVRWDIFVSSPHVQRAYQGACRELALAVGGRKCMFLADSCDNREPGMTLDEFETSLGYPPEASFAALHGGNNGSNVNLARYYIDRFEEPKH